MSCLVCPFLALGLAAGLAQPAFSAPQHSGPLVPGLQQDHPLDERQVGQLLFTELRCSACHEPSRDTGLPEKAAPRLDDVGFRVAPEYLKRFIVHPAAVEPGTTMPDLLGAEPIERRNEIAAAITEFLVSRSSQPFRRDPVDEQDVAKGHELFHSIGCIACHASNEAQLPGEGVSLAQVPSKYSVRSLTEFLFQPTRIRPSGRMPDMNLSRDEARVIASYLLGIEITSAFSPATATGLADTGRKYFEQFRCASCHELEGVPTPEPATPLDRLGLTAGCLSTHPTGAPDYELSLEQTQALRKGLSAPAEAFSGETQTAFTLTAFNCIACHVRDDYGGVSKAKDPYFTTSQNNLGNEARIPPQLTLTGAKLRPEWMRRVLFDGASVRPYMHTRMPQFGEENLGHLPALLERTDRLESITIVEPQGDARRIVRDAGKLLLGDKGMSCITCHDFNSKPSPNFRGVDLIGSFERLTPNWFVPYMLSPQQFRPGTVMPNYWSAQESDFPDVLDGDTQAQIEALWFVLSLGRSAPDPSGIRSVSSKLHVSDRPRTYRGRSGIAGFRGIAVGFPGGLNYAFNAETGALTGIWRGEFAQVRWGGQGAGDFSPSGRAVSLAKDLPFARLANDQAPWPLLPKLNPEEPVNTDPLYPGNHGYQFKGYFFDDAEIPTFLYQSGDVEIEDRSEADSTEERPVLRRTFHFIAPRDETLYLRVLTGDIQLLSPMQFMTPELRLNVPEAPTVLRPNGADPSMTELLLKLALPEGESTVRIDYEILR
jgi:mono/diheme cytochrome c family protein